MAILPCSKWVQWVYVFLLIIYLLLLELIRMVYDLFRITRMCSMINSWDRADQRNMLMNILNYAYCYAICLWCMVSQERRLKDPEANIWAQERFEWAEGGWRRLHIEELHILYRLPYIARVIKSRRLRWAGHLARMEEFRRTFKILTGTPTG